MGTSNTLQDTLEALHGTLAQMARWGCRGFVCSEQSLATLEGWVRPIQPREQGDTLECIRTDLGDCHRCRLAEQRTHIVFGEGHAQARIVFVGEGPGFDEDQSGRPFVGAAGQLLTRIIQAMKVTREEVYICNVIKCRPPNNRNPEPDEIRTCRPFLERQLAAIAPQVICTLGTFASQTLLDTTAPVSKLRGRFHTYAGIKVMPTYHPAYLLRNPEQKRAVWEDMKKIMAFLRIPL